MAKMQVNMAVKFYDNSAFIKKVLYSRYFLKKKLQANLPVLSFKG